MGKLEVKELLEAGVHFGHLTRKWNPNMAPFIYMERNGIHIINLYKTVAKIDEASEALKKIAASGRKILFVATKKQAKEIVAESASKVNMPYITERWPGGMLTNFVTIRKAVKKMAAIDRMKKDGTFNTLSKKERLQVGRLREKLEKNLGSISDMTRLPGALFVVDIIREHIAIKEAQKLNIPIFAMVDTNSDPREVEYVIPSNDDASKSITKIKGKIFDTKLAHYIINPDTNHSINQLSETYLNYSLIDLQLLTGKGKNQKLISDLAVDQIKNFICEQADVNLQLKSLFKIELNNTKLFNLFDEIEIPLLKVLADMEIQGINLDIKFLELLKTDLINDISSLEELIYTEAGENFNISSPKQLGEVLFEKMQLVKNPKKTKTGQFSTSEDILKDLSSEHDFVKNILQYRSLSKLMSTYVDSLPNQVLSSTNRVHTEYLQTVASTGRLSSINPNLQNIPIRTKRGREVRKAFIPKDENYFLLAADYSQIELRIIASMSGEKNMIKAFNNNEDIHSSTASIVFDIPVNEVTKTQRSNAKTVNFGIIYGVSAFGLSNQTDLSRSESKELIETYYHKYPNLKKFISDQIAYARNNGYVKTLIGRKRYLKDINSSNGLVRSGAERNAVNAPIQGTAADIIKIAMINIHNRLSKENLSSKMLLQVHDELVFDVYKPEIRETILVIKEEMENAFKLNIPLTVDIDYGLNWLEAH